MNYSTDALVLACGESRRFPQYDRPKQFLKFTWGGVEAQMWQHALYGLTVPATIHLAIRKDHRHFYEPVDGVHLIELDPTTGQADTLRKALAEVPKQNRDVLVVNCDQGFGANVLNKLVHYGRFEDLPAAITFKASKEEANRWSYVNKHPWFDRAAEKAAIGTHALAGAYYFPHRQELVNAVEAACSNTKQEPYISHVFNWLYGVKYSLEIHRDDWHDWGTAESFQKSTGEK